MSNPNGKENLDATFHNAKLVSTEVVNLLSDGFRMRVEFQHETEKGQSRKLAFNVSLAQLLEVQDQVQKKIAEMGSERFRAHEAIRYLCTRVSEQERNDFIADFSDVFHQLTR